MIEKIKRDIISEVQDKLKSSIVNKLKLSGIKSEVDGNVIKLSSQKDEDDMLEIFENIVGGEL